MAVAPFGGIVARFLGNAVSESFAFAAGVAIGPVLAPATEELRQAAWHAHQARLPDVAALAAGVAQGKVDEGTAREWSKRHGYGDDSFTALHNIALSAPDVAVAMRALRRDELTPAEFTTVLKRHGIAERWNAAILALRAELLEPAQLAAAIHRGLIPDPGLLKGEQPTAPFKVEAYPVYPIDADAEAKGAGIDHERLGVLVGLQGLPMGTHEAAQAFFRGIITHGDYVRAFNESNSRNEWAAAVLEYSRQIPTATQLMENALRGHHDLEWALGQASRHGMTREDAFVLYQNQGRALNLHQITQALAWGGKYQPGPGDDGDPWMQAVLLGAVRPEYYNLQHSLKYLLPSAFYFRTLQEQGVVSEAEAVTWYRRIGWPPELAEKVAHAYAKKDTATAPDPLVTKAEGQLWTAIHRDYVKQGVPRDAADAALQMLTADVAVRNRVFALWDEERRLNATPAPPA